MDGSKSATDLRDETAQTVLIEDSGPNPLQEYFARNNARLIHKWAHYFEIYHRHFHPFRGRPVTVVEFGVYHGGSLQMWKDYFGKSGRIIGVDISPKCKCLEEEQIEIVIGDQENREFLRRLGSEIGPIDILVDDGGHKMGQQIATFEEMFPIVRPGGIYLIEDLHTSYWEEYGGKFKGRGTFVEYAKGLIDHLHAWHSPNPTELAVTYYTRHIKGMHVYDSVIVFDKDTVQSPEVHKTGKESF
ncbi:MAG: hypothetical protein V7609_1926 [Verrucomicrobiota bacterium]